ncbi:MAG TPA: hypothetical protein PK413_13985 [Thermoanaerobaculia bacterium]|nr:hypothetical protein [Thermoanaerobaculia bacterium]
MSCPSWPELIAERERTGEDSPAFEAALAHLEGCAACREHAYREDPLLLFRRLPRPAVGGGDIEAMKVAVATLRRTSDVAQPLAESPASWRRGSAPGALRWPAAAAFLAGLSLLLAGGGNDHWSGLPGSRNPSAPSAGRSTAVRMPREVASVAPAAAALEDLSLPEARVYQLSQDELQVVMIVDPSLNL